MTRFVAAAGALLAVAAIAAGCGGASLRSVALQDAKQYLDASNARVLSIETVRLEGGDRHAVARMQGRFRFDRECFGRRPHERSQRACGPYWTHYAVLEFNLSTPTLAGYWSGSPAEDSAIAAARHDARFGIFPDVTDLLVQCTIPGGWGGSVPGTCSTSGGRSGAVFTEHWPLSKKTGSRYSTTWVVTVDRSSRIVSVRRSGNLPPQLWKSPAQPAVPPSSVTRARRELPYLKSFPQFPGRSRCTMEAGGPRLLTLHGACTTKVLPRDGNRPVLEFVERWRIAGRTYTGGWIVTLRHDDRVLTVRVTGSNPPQSWR